MRQKRRRDELRSDAFFSLSFFKYFILFCVERFMRLNIFWHRSNFMTKELQITNNWIALHVSVSDRIDTAAPLEHAMILKKVLQIGRQDQLRRSARRMQIATQKIKPHTALLMCNLNLNANCEWDTWNDHRLNIMSSTRFHWQPNAHWLVGYNHRFIHPFWRRGEINHSERFSVFISFFFFFFFFRANVIACKTRLLYQNAHKVIAMNIVSSSLASNWSR